MRPTLPAAPSLPVEHLAAGFGDVTNAYKFYWLLAILAELQPSAGFTMPISRLLAQMVAAAWTPAVLFRLHFGKQDRLGELALALQSAHGLPVTPRAGAIVAAAEQAMQDNTPLGQTLRSLQQYVPYRFLRPCFAAPLRGVKDWQVNGRIRQLAAHAFAAADAPCLYRFVGDGEPHSIELHPAWADYLQRNLAIVTGYARWHLTTYLQRNNPNAPNIAGKLAAPGQRVLRDARRFWQIVQEAHGPLRCLYSGEILGVAASLDHFLPWRFVAHDLLWNLAPAARHVNSAKSDQLPDFARYFEPFATLQYAAVQAVAAQGKAALLEDYVLLFKRASLDDLRALPYAAFRRGLEETLAPQFQIARSLGFGDGWSYTP